MPDTVDVAVIGAGPYGLSVAAHLRAKGIEHRIIGDPMQFWRRHMPKGMLLKSDGFASTLYDPDAEFTLRKYCEQQKVAYADLGVPVRVEVFCAYGLAFQRRFAPQLENKSVALLERERSGFRLELNDGDSLSARRVVIATGLSQFEYIPPPLANLPAGLVSHSSAHVDLRGLKGRDVTVVGGGASATELATLLHEQGVKVRMIARRRHIELHSRMDLPRPFSQSIQCPISPVGPGWKHLFFTNFPLAFYNLPKQAQHRLIRGFLGPAGGWFLRGRFEAVQLLAGYHIERAARAGDGVVLSLRSEHGGQHRVETEHVIAATGYRPDIRRLPILPASITSGLKLLNDVPELSSHFESSIPGLFFVGPTAIESFGPLLRFACGARFASVRVSKHLARASSSARRHRSEAERECAYSGPQ
jgi:lysine/ornithine N-monooxygenase